MLQFVDTQQTAKDKVVSLLNHHAAFYNKYSCLLKM